MNMPHTDIHTSTHRNTYTPCSSIDSPGHGSRLSREVVVEIEGVKMEEGGPCHSADGALGNLGKNCVP